MLTNGEAGNDDNFIQRSILVASHQTRWLLVVVWRSRSRGYGHVSFNGEVRRAHRVAYELAHGVAPGNLVVRHSCDTPACVNPDHLLLGTQLDNIADRNMRGRTAKGDRSGPRTHPECYPGLKGEQNGRAKLTWTQVE